MKPSSATEESPENPSAFPEMQTAYDDSEHEYTGNVYSTGGMTLRDYFAAKALQGYLSSYSGTAKLPPADHAAGWAYTFADAMLRERVK